MLLLCLQDVQQKPIIPQPSGYKPMVINDIRSQVHKGRYSENTLDVSVFVFVQPGNHFLMWKFRGCRLKVVS